MHYRMGHKISDTHCETMTVLYTHFNPSNYSGHCMWFVQFSQQRAIIIFLVGVRVL